MTLYLGAFPLIVNRLGVEWLSVVVEELVCQANARCFGEVGFDVLGEVVIAAMIWYLDRCLGDLRKLALHSVAQHDML